MLTDADLEDMRDTVEAAQPSTVEIQRKVKTRVPGGGTSETLQTVAIVSGRKSPAGQSLLLEMGVAERMSGRVGVVWTLPVADRWVWLVETTEELRSSDKLVSDGITYEILAVPPRDYEVALKVVCARNT